jgi:hypothetical protein
VEFWLFVALFYLPSLLEDAQEPMDGWLPAAVELENLDCEPITVDGARQIAPGRIPEPSARGDFLERRAVICRERLMSPGIRRAGDDAMLSGLSGHAEEMAALVAALEPDERERTWLVETFHPDPAVGHKIGFAVKNALMGRSLKVSDRAPTLAAGDIQVIGSLEPAAAYPLACTRYAAAGSLGAGDGLLAIVLRDRSETILHAGICTDGRWRWMR